MCYEYIKEQSAVRKDSAKQTASTDRGSTAPAEPVTSRAQADKERVELYLAKIRRMFASRKREEPTSV